MSEESEPRHRHDEAADAMYTTFSDEPVAETFEYTFGGARHVMHVDAAGRPVRSEVHGYSNLRRHQEQTVQQIIHADLSKTEPIGEIEWVITEEPSGVQILQGKRVVGFGEVAIRTIESPERAQASKMVPLAGPFLFEACTGSTESAESVGFALKSERTDEHTFCWEWFNIDGPAHATKLQETGELAYKMDNPGGRWQVVRTELLTDVSLRVTRFTNQDHSPDWRVKIVRGSWINWPSVVDGTVVA